MQERQDREDSERKAREASIDSLNLPPPPVLSASVEDLTLDEALPPPPSESVSGIPPPPAPPPLPPRPTDGSVPPAPPAPPLPRRPTDGSVPPAPSAPPLPRGGAIPVTPPVVPSVEGRPLPAIPNEIRNQKASSITSLEYQEIQNAINEIDNIDIDTPQPPILPPPPTIPAPPLPPGVDQNQQAKQKLAMKQSLTIEVPDNENLNKLQVKGPSNVESLSPKMEKKLNTLLSGPENENGAVLIPNGKPPMSPVTPLSPGSDGGDFGEVYDMLEYAEKYFNDHPKDTSGTLMKSFKKKRDSTLVRLTMIIFLLCSDINYLTLLHSERPKLYTILAFLSAIGLNKLYYDHILINM